MHKDAQSWASLEQLWLSNFAATFLNRTWVAKIADQGCPPVSLAHDTLPCCLSAPIENRHSHTILPSVWDRCSDGWDDPVSHGQVSSRLTPLNTTSPLPAPLPHYCWRETPLCVSTPHQGFCLKGLEPGWTCLCSSGQVLVKTLSCLFSPHLHCLRPMSCHASDT